MEKVFAFMLNYIKILENKEWKKYCDKQSLNSQIPTNDSNCEAYRDDV